MSNFFDVWGRTFAQGGEVNSVEDVLARTGTGNPSTAITQTLYGLNHRSLANSIPINKDYYGLTFFTKPDLRLDNPNCLKLRKFAPLLTTRENSLPRAIRAMLDFRHNTHNEESYLSALIDPKQIFIPLLTNQLISLSGWHDIELPTYSSDLGVYGEQFSFADGITEIYRCFDLTANFRNIPGDPITMLFYYWVMYAAAVYEGTLTPYANNAAENTIDYQTRIYRVVLDSSKRFVQKIACTGAAFPINVPLGAAFDFDSDTPINRNDQISITFRAVGAEYMDDIIIHDFNKAVCIGNNDMIDGQRTGAGLIKVPYEYIFLFNYLGYPRINPTTFELEWWVYKETFSSLTGETNFSSLSGERGVVSALANRDGLILKEEDKQPTNSTGNPVEFKMGEAATTVGSAYTASSDVPPVVTSSGTWDPNTYPLGKLPPSFATDSEIMIYNARSQAYLEKLYGVNS